MIWTAAEHGAVVAGCVASVKHYDGSLDDCQGGGPPACDQLYMFGEGTFYGFWWHLQLNGCHC